MTRTTLVSRYLGFAIIATVANLVAQRIVLRGDYLGLTLLHAMIVGTAVGLAVKYALDKRYIFHDTATGLSAHGRRFSLYALMGVGTTLLFWGMEATFWHFGQTDTMREMGAVIGISLGYVLKYHLDRHFVFDKPLAARST